MTKVSLLLASIVLSLSGQDPAANVGQSKVMAAPALPYYDWKACPFEGCTYREWTALKSTVVFETWNKKSRQVARISMKEKVTGITGGVITFRPGTIRMERDLPEDGLKRGDIVLTYSYRGEGFSAVWFKGRYYPEFDITFARADGKPCSDTSCAGTYVDMGRKVWWAQVKLPSGQIGWVNMNEAEFDGVDQLAGLPRLTAAGA
jgi:hypothetical protein